MRNESKLARGYWDYTTLDPRILEDAARLTEKDLAALARPGFDIRFFDTLESFFITEALEYVWAWKKSTADTPTGICGPIGPIEQLPLVAQIVNDLQIDVREGHFWGMDEWYVDGREVPITHPLSFARADMDLCFRRIDKKLRMPESHLHFIEAGKMDEYSRSYDEVKCLIMQGGQGDVKHWAFNDPPKREGRDLESPPSPDEYKSLSARIVDLHPMTVIQNARTAAGGVISAIPAQALSVGPRETWKAQTVSIWHPGWHDNPFGLRLTTLMISKRIPDSSVPMSLLADHPHVRFNFYRGGIGTCATEVR